MKFPLIMVAVALTLAPGVSLARPKPAKLKPIEVPTASAADWREVDPENVLVIDSTKGKIYVELMPLAAPATVERIKLLTRQHFYDGLKFHRVLNEFMAQTGDPLGTGEGGSSYPNVKAEFTFRRDASVPLVPVASPAGGVVGFIDSFPVQSQPDDLMAMTKDHKVTAWGLFCPGVAGMARSDPEDSANSQFFLMRQTFPSLEKRYTAFGRVLVGLDAVRAFKTGEPVIDPDKMITVQMLADMPAASRPKLMLLDTRSRTFQAEIEKARQAKGADFSICDLQVPVEVR